VDTRRAPCTRDRRRGGQIDGYLIDVSRRGFRGREDASSDRGGGSHDPPAPCWSSVKTPVFEPSERPAMRRWAARRRSRRAALAAAKRGVSRRLELEDATVATFPASPPPRRKRPHPVVLLPQIRFQTPCRGVLNVLSATRFKESGGGRAGAGA